MTMQRVSHRVYLVAGRYAGKERRWYFYGKTEAVKALKKLAEVKS